MRKDRAATECWCNQLADLIQTELQKRGLLLEVGVGEATTLAGVLGGLPGLVDRALGFDVSLSRIEVAKAWMREQSQQAELFVGDLLHIPLMDNRVDVVYSSHSLEPNAGREHTAIAECLRVARHAVVLVEPLYELASPEAQARMRHHGYVRGLKAAAEQLGAEVLDYRLLDYASNPLNPSGVLKLRKKTLETSTNDQATKTDNNISWACPLTGTRLEERADVYFAPDIGLAYPILRGVPLLRPEHAVVASGIGPY